jgi:uncharacterized membrane protein
LDFQYIATYTILDQELRIMVKCSAWFFLIGILLFPLKIAAGQTEQPGSNGRGGGSIGPIPVLFSTPETGFGFGAALLYYRYPHQ